MPAGPARLRNKVTSKTGRPGALAASGTDGPEATRHRVCAAEASSRAPGRIRMTVTPDLSAAKASRRVAVRSSIGWLPQGSSMTAPSPRQRAASTPARKTPTMSRTPTRISRAGSSPKAARPGI